MNIETSFNLSPLYDRVASSIWFNYVIDHLFMAINFNVIWKPTDHAIYVNHKKLVKYFPTKNSYIACKLKDGLLIHSEKFVEKNDTLYSMTSY